MKFKKGDTVYAVSLAGKIFKTKIKAVHAKTQPQQPYELDIKTKARHYQEDAVFSTRKEAEKQLTKENLDKVEEALQHKDSMRMVQAVTPNEDGSYYGHGGKLIKPDFSLSDKEVEELNGLASQLDLWLAKHNLPYVFCVVTAKEDNKSGQHVRMRRTACFPGPRTPDWMRTFYMLLEGFLSEGSSEED